MQLDIRNYLKKVRETQDLDQLEQEFVSLIDTVKQFNDPRYEKSPLLQWFAINQLNQTKKPH